MRKRGLSGDTGPDLKGAMMKLILSLAAVLALAGCGVPFVPLI
ncbi:MAG: hypothetical protein Q4G14_03095 [Paracoccus sp. (in: a-proteobacteria)]|nr:hypothetical protein [Paracoccus sp. (in: a-proteobacteria)]MDO5612212.1 hypothetical protein [Paracoccus sp. (in: a-proteobacteria)]